MGYKHTREEMLAGAVDAALAEGLSQLTFGRLAKRLGVGDRMIVYYFPSKDALVSSVLLAMGERLQHVLSAAFREPAADHLALARMAWPVLAGSDTDRLFATFFEANGLAAAGAEPYRTVVPQLVEAWVTWIAEFLQGPARRRREEAEATVALIDGLLLLRLLAGPAAATRAATRLGVLPLRG
jgi:AcrR family transcriptional regulator